MTNIAFFLCFIPLLLFQTSTVSNPPTIQPNIATTESSNDVFDDDDSDEAITDDNDNTNIVNIVDKSNSSFLYLFSSHLFN